MRINLNDYSLMNRRLLPELEAAFRGVVASGEAEVHPHVTEFEKEACRRLGDGQHAIGVQSGTAALFLCLLGLGIGPGDEVITAPNSDISTTAAISHSGAGFVLCDVEGDTFNLDPAKLEACITPRTKAIVPVHLYGHPADMDPILDVARRHGLSVVEDAALALGATYRGYLVGTLGTAGCFSFAPSKVVGAVGHGGMVVTGDKELASRVRLTAGYGLPPSVQELPSEERGKLGPKGHVAEGYNVRLDGLQAAILGVKLRYVKEWADLRQAVADRYAVRFSGTPVVPPAVRPGCVHAWRNYVVRTPRREEVRMTLWAQGIATSTLYAPPVHLQPVYRHLGLRPGTFPVSERLAEEILCLPMYPGLGLEQVDEVAEAVLRAVNAGVPR